MVPSPALTRKINLLLDGYLRGTDPATAPERAFAARCNALPFYSDRSGCLAIRPDGVLFYDDLGPLSASSEWRGDEDGWSVTMALVVASERYPELRELLPRRPSGAPPCGACVGQGRTALPGWGGTTPCVACRGLGWLAPEGGGALRLLGACFSRAGAEPHWYSERADLWCDGTLAAVIDGKGVYQTGMRAAELVRAALVETFGAPETAPPVLASASAPGQLLAALSRAEERIVSFAASDPVHQGAGATFAAALQVGDELHIAHLGDVLALRIRDGRAEALYELDTLEVLALREGMRAEIAAMDPEIRRCVVRCLGLADGKGVAVHVERPRPGDVLVLCSKGVWKNLALEDLAARALRQRADMEGLAVGLCGIAVGRSYDDTTCVVLRA